MSQKQNDPSIFILSTHRIIFPHLDVPHAFESDDPKEKNDPVFDCTWLIPVTHPDAQALMIAFQQIHAAEALSKFKGMPFDQIGQPDGIWCPLRSGDQYADKMIARGKDAALYEPYRGHYFIKATSAAEWQPTVYQQLAGQGRQEVIDIKNTIYGGCYARGVLKLMGWANKGKYGFSAFINSVLKTAEGPKLGGGGSANPGDYDLGADATDASTLLPGDVAAPTGPAGLPMPGMAGSTLPQMPGARPALPGAAIPPAAQRPALPGMMPPPVQQSFVPPAMPAYTPPPMPVVTPPIAPMYNESDGKPIVSFDSGVTWEWVS